MEFATFDRRALLRYGPLDLVGILAMVWLGELRHGNDPLAVPFIYLDTLAPFLIGWVVAAFALGAYGSRTLDGYRTALGYGLGAWFVGNAIGQGLRATDLFHGGTEAAFFVVMFLFIGVALVVGRAVVVTVLGD